MQCVARSTWNGNEGNTYDLRKNRTLAQHTEGDDFTLGGCVTHMCGKITHTHTLERTGHTDVVERTNTKKLRENNFDCVRFLRWVLFCSVLLPHRRINRNRGNRGCQCARSGRFAVYEWIGHSVCMYCYILKCVSSELSRCVSRAVYLFGCFPKTVFLGICCCCRLLRRELARSRTQHTYTKTHNTAKGGARDLILFFYGCGCCSCWGFSYFGMGDTHFGWDQEALSFAVWQRPRSAANFSG